jgi:hypothetical protein
MWGVLSILNNQFLNSIPGQTQLQNPARKLNF